MSTSPKTKLPYEEASRDKITMQLGVLQDFQRNVRLVYAVPDKNNAAEIIAKLKYTQMQVDSEIRDQFRNILAAMSASKLEQIQMIKDQENTTNKIIVLRKQGEEMREEIQQLHNLIAKITSQGGSHFNSSFRAPLTQEFDI